MAFTAAADDVDLTRDRRLVERAQAGDLEAFGHLYARYFRRLVRFSAKRVGDHDEAEEIAQEAFARAYRALPTFGGDRRFYPWITVIASRLCIDSIRRRGRVEVGEVADCEILDAGFERLDREGDLALLSRALDRLHPRHREVLELREREGWSYQHIADHYQVTLGTVEALLWRARKALRREFTALCSSVAGVPLLRRLVLGGHRSQTGTLAALGSVGAVVALGVSGWQATPPPAPTKTVLFTVTAAHRLPGAALAALQPVAVPATLPPIAGSAGDGATEASGGTVSSRSTAGGRQGLLPQPRLMTQQAAAAAARQKPIVVAVGKRGPIIGLDPGVPVPPIHVEVGTHP